MYSFLDVALLLPTGGFYVDVDGRSSTLHPHRSDISKGGRIQEAVLRHLLG